MKKLQQFVALTLILTCAIAPIYGQDPYYQDYPEGYQINQEGYQDNPVGYQDYQEGNQDFQAGYQEWSEDDACSAYVQSSHAAHWSVYIPIAILVGAAIFWGLADGHHSDHHSYSDSQDALGSIANSKRRLGSSYGSSGSYKSYSSYRSSQGSYSHYSSY